MNKNSNKTLKRVAAYIRVSTDKQAKKGDSLEEQRDTLMDYINKNSDMVLHRVYVDDGISGQKLNRDDFSELINDVQSGLIDLIIFTRLDRWFRSLRHYLNTQAMLEQYGVSWTAVSQPYFDTSTAHGRAFVAQSMTWAELEAQNDSERILAVFDNKVRHGEVISGTAPLGYSIVDKHLVPNQEAEKIKKLYEYYYHTPNIRSTMRYAIEELGINRSHHQIKRIIQNTKYKGSFRDNKEYCLPIVDESLWEECNHLLRRNQRANKTHDYVFAGLIACGDCGRKMSACTVKKRAKKGSTIQYNGSEGHYRYPAYRCQGYSMAHRCINRKQFYEKTLEKKIVSMLRSEINKFISDYEASQAPIMDRSAQIRKIESKIAKLKELYVNDLITLEEFKIDRARYEEQIAEINAIDIKERDLTPIRNLLSSDIELIYNTMNVEEKQFFWRSFIDIITIDKDYNIKIIFR